MHEFHGDLLIGGIRLKQVHGQLETEDHPPGSHKWQLAGHLHLSPEQSALLETDRQYLLVLEDGRSGAVVLSRIAPEEKDALLVDFEPSCERSIAKPR
ncbi:MAG: hypothetical protein SFU86_22590 [Pirellulaceae bacterium]|nr:hypothetical protein [Pirellulaceae bacterium]